MKSRILKLAARKWPFVLLTVQIIFVSGCTSVLWDRSTFARDYHPADPANLHLYYSNERKDILVHYDELNVTDKKVQPRFYWLEPNATRINDHRKPQFVSARASEDLIPILLSESQPDFALPDSKTLYAVSKPKEHLFALYLGPEQVDLYWLPDYRGSSQRVKQVLLTPFAVAVDATVIGAVVCYVNAPSILSGLNRR
jgi:hypothetical protein